MSEELIQRLRVAPTASHFLKPAHLYQDLIAERSEAADYIEEQAARIAEFEAALDSDADGSGFWRFWSDKAAEQAKRAAASQARLSEAVKVLEEVANAGKSWNARQDMEAFFMISNSIESAKAFLATLGEENEA